MYDLAIIGAGIIGAQTAYRLSRFKLKILWLEKENDVALGATRANSAIVHAGYDPPAGSQMARLNVEGSRMMPELCKTLSAYYRQTGSLVLAFSEAEKQHLSLLLDRGRANGVPGLRILSRSEILAMEPAVNPDVTAALYAPTAAIILPWELCLAAAETAVREGVDLRLRQEVSGLERRDGHWLIRAGETFRARYVINASGTSAAEIHEMYWPKNFEIVPTRGEYYLLDKAAEPKVSHVLFQTPGPLGKGVLVAPTIHGNTLIGPNAEIVEAGDTATTAAGLSEIAAKARLSVPGLKFGRNIRNFAGVRANREIDDFYIAYHEPGYLDLAAMKSPGLSASPAIAREAEEMLAAHGLVLEEKEHWDKSRRSVRFAELSADEKTALAASDPAFGRVICRCQTITEGEILRAVHSVIPPCSLDGIKRRTGAGLGRCQGGFCGPRVLEILRRETGLPPEAILQDREGSYIVLGDNRPEVGLEAMSHED